MARKKKYEERENHERWLISYADFITLLFAFFVVMYSVSSVNEGKYRVLSDALLSAFHSQPKSLEPIQVGQQSKAAVLAIPKVKIIPDIMMSRNITSYPGTNANDSGLAKISDDVHLAMSNLIDLGMINVRRNDLWLEVEINNSILFKSGSARIKESVVPVLKELAATLYAYPNSIRVEGHTDSDNISTEKFPSNWELSAARAASIARVLEKSNVLPDRLSVVGYGATRPVADNSTEEGKAKNRRVVIVIVANNDIAKTVKSSKSSAEVDFPETKVLVTEGVVEEQSPQTIDGTDEKQDSAITDRSDREISLYRDTVAGSLPGSSVKPSRNIINNSALAPPNRLFYPIQLPSPFSINNPGQDTKE